MKKVFVLMFGLMVSSASFANSNLSELGNPPIEARLYAREKGKVELFISEEKTVASILLKDEMGNVIFQVKRNLDKGLAQRFDVSHLDDGTYQFSISAGSEEVTQMFYVEAEPSDKIIKIIEE